MRIKQKARWLPIVLAVVCAAGARGLVVAATTAPQASSSSYRVNEVFFGSGGELHSCSATYCSKQAAGETTIGNTNSATYQAQGGFNTERQPSLQFTVSNSSIDLGALNSGTTATATASFSVKSYLASGYVVRQTSPGPTNGTYVMNSPNTPAASAVGTEQFGINLAANTSPKTFGAAPVQVPDASFSYGQVSSDYATANKYKYVRNDTIAYSNQSSGQTNYTISYIFNISNITPGGTYTLHHVLVATSTF